MKKRVSDTSIILNCILTIMYSAYAILYKVQLTVDSISTIVSLLLILLYCLLAIRRGYVRLQSVGRYVLIMLLIGLEYSLLTTHVNTSHPVLGYLTLLSQDFIPIVIFVSLRKRAVQKEMKAVFIILSAMLLYTYIQSIVEIQLNPRIIHILTKTSYNDDLSSVKSVVTIDLIYGSISVVAFALYVACGSRLSKPIRIVSIGAVVLVVVLLYIADFTTSLLLTGAILCIELLFLGKQNVGKVIVLLAILILALFLPDILYYASAHVDSANMAERLSSLADLLCNKYVSGSDMSARLSSYSGGLAAFLRSPLWGNREISVNPHSQFLQFAADLGLIGLLPYIYLLKKSRKTLSFYFDGEKRKVFLISYSVLIMTGLFNPILKTPATAIIVWLYVPLGLSLWHSDDNANTPKAYTNRHP